MKISPPIFARRLHFGERSQKKLCPATKVHAPESFFVLKPQGNSVPETLTRKLTPWRDGSPSGSCGDCTRYTGHEVVFFGHVAILKIPPTGTDVFFYAFSLLN
ncbi:hypothetical protein RUM44_006942 [Polyplax serrata]|uniref:Uncharacterized protein n=1 Tax=Polyplax serrata TaxID=468196 RepID=A0ABR1AZC6_POLSC